jgi:hypothetical protein
MSAKSEIVEERLAKVRALVFALEMVAEREGGLDVRGAPGRLRIMALEELDRVKTALKGEAFDRDC